jgi:hypothetical protein
MVARIGFARCWFASRPLRLYHHHPESAQFNRSAVSSFKQPAVRVRRNQVNTASHRIEDATVRRYVSCFLSSAVQIRQDRCQGSATSLVLHSSMPMGLPQGV